MHPTEVGILREDGESSGKDSGNADARTAHLREGGNKNVSQVQTTHVPTSQNRPPRSEHAPKDTTSPPRYRKGVLTTQSNKPPRRTNGSRRKATICTQPVKRWQTEGIHIGSVNIRGLTYLKLLVLLERADLDVLCV